MKIQENKITDLIPYINNPRTHTKEQINQIVASIKEFGFCNPVLIDEDLGIIAGHGRVEAAKKLELEKVPCVVLDGLSEAQKKAYVIADNKLALNAVWNEDLLSSELERLKELDFDSELLGFDIQELDGIMSYGSETTEGMTDRDDAPEPQDTPVSKMGDVWILDNHRVMCGDSANHDDVEILMNEKKINMIFSDPPYGVSYSEKNNFLNSLDKGNRNQTPIKHDNGTLDETAKLWGKVFSVWSEYFLKISCYYLTGPQGGELSMMMMMMNNNGFPVRHTLIWSKNNHVLGRCDYNYKHEPILYGWKEIHEFYGKGMFKTSIWNIDRPIKSELHPTMKPVDLIENCLLNSTLKNHLVADMFGGSGSTLIACESNRRTCYTMEIEPSYVDVIIKRWQDFTGKQATHEETGKTFNEIKCNV